MRKVRMNNMAVINNQYQRFDEFKRMLTVCSGACLRSPTAAVVLSQDPFNFNTRAVGMDDEYAIVQMDPVLMEWADEIVVMELWMKQVIDQRFEDHGTTIYVLDIPDRFEYRDPELIKLIKDRYLEVTSE